MGTVGLSFGSPTSGTGINVSSTVAAIVSNLQNIETPWKSQLTSLQSQDTAISSLGTLLSTVSNDISQLTDATGILAQKTGSSSDTNVLQLTSASAAAAAGTHTVVVNTLAQTSSGYLAPLSSASTPLSGSITIKAGSGAAQTITLNSSDNTLAGLAAAINSSGAGITANVLTDANGSRLSLISGSSGANGNIAISSNSLTAAASHALSYTGTGGTSTANSTGTLSPVSSAGAALSGTVSIQVGSGSSAQSMAINMSAVATAEGGATISDLASYINSNLTTMGVQATVVANSDGTSSLQLYSQMPGAAGTLTVNSSLVDPATALGYTQTASGQNASLTVDGVNLSSASNTVTNLIPGLTFQLLAPSPTTSGSAEPVQVSIANDNASVESTVNQFVSDYNSLLSAMHSQQGNTSSGTPEPLFGSPTLSLLQNQLMSALNAPNPNGYLAPVTVADNPSLSGSITIQVGSGTAQTVTLNSSQTSLSDLAGAINAAGIGVTAGVTTSNGDSTLTLLSQTPGAAGALAVTSNIQSSAATQLTSATFTASSSSNSGTSFSSVPGASDVLTGTVTIQVGSGTTQTVNMSDVQTAQGGSTLADLENYLNANSSTLGVSASINTNSDGSQSLQLASLTAGSDGNLTVGGTLADTATPTTSALGYTSSSDIGNLAALGITTTPTGGLALDVSTLDSVLNSDFSGVQGFFQNIASWGQNLSTTINQAGSSSKTGLMSLASNANSTIESQLSAKISNEDSLISAQQSSLTTQLNQANEILQMLPSQLNGINELYAAISGYNGTSNG
jgi:flagellar hook-associated protein 2